MKIRYLLALALLPATLHAADPAWIEYGPDGPIARTIVTNGGACPSIDIDGVSSVMRTRALPSTGYPVTACEAALPAGVRSARIGDHKLPVHKLGRTAKVALLGDTGCRKKAPNYQQNCETAWPFAQIAESIAKWDPDVVLHVGDYYYREATCKGSTCTNAPYNWDRWQADFFRPAKPLLGNAPWVLTRGNHEECSRAAEGWFRFLDPRPYLWENVKTCKSNTDFTPPYVANVGAMQFIVMDSSALDENDPTQASMIAGQLALYSKLKPGAWLLLHHPFWASDYGDIDTPTLWQAWSEAGAATKPISLVLTGHVHLLELLSFNDGGPPLALVGNGGTQLDPKTTDITGQQAGTRTVASFTQDDTFGFIAATPSPSGWTFDVRKADGASKTKCAVTSTSIVCD